MNTGSTRSILPGISLAIVVAVSATLVRPLFPAFGSVTLGLLLGMALGNLVSPGRNFTSGIKFTEKQILAFAIMLMGLNLQLKDLFELGPVSVLIIIPTVLVTIGSALLLEKYFGYTPGFNLIMGVGNAV